MQELIGICKRGIVVYRLRRRIAALIRDLMKQARTTTEPIPLNVLQTLNVLRGPLCWVAPKAIECEVRRIRQERGLS